MGSKLTDRVLEKFSGGKKIFNVEKFLSVISCSEKKLKKNECGFLF
jgi:hypothetical protein